MMIMVTVLMMVTVMMVTCDDNLTVIMLFNVMVMVTWGNGE